MTYWRQGGFARRYAVVRGAFIALLVAFSGLWAYSLTGHDVLILCPSDRRCLFMVGSTASSVEVWIAYKSSGLLARTGMMSDHSPYFVKDMPVFPWFWCSYGEVKQPATGFWLIVQTPYWAVMSAVTLAWGMLRWHWRDPLALAARREVEGIVPVC